jgi:RNA polymerase sigma-70 factor, ECF subfamily
MHDSATTRAQQLFVRHQAAVRSYALALTGDFAAAEDVVQETFLTVTEKAADYVPGTNFVAWACTIARFKVLEHGRSDRRFSTAVVDSLTASLPAEDIAEDRLEKLLLCLERLPPRAKELIRLRYFSEHGPGEIAQLLGRSVAGVNSALLKARDMLRDCVAGLRHAGGSTMETTV